jgi:Na+-translocating ferredoxin:NAD+ oxidoreductase subunit B
MEFSADVVGVNKSLPKLPTLSDAIDAVLPQTQCTRCGYPACRPYAEAIAAGEADINQCPPGGDDGIRLLASITARPYQPLNPQNGIESPRKLAWIDETRCIGCTLCIAACPVDAIVGGFKFMHTVIAEDCTGCELCIAPCPVDCIALQEINGPSDWTQDHAAKARRLFETRNKRLEKIRASKERPLASAEKLSHVLKRARERAAKRAREAAGENGA